MLEPMKKILTSRFKRVLYAVTLSKEYDMNIHAQRLMNVCKALRESPNPSEFTMWWYGSGGSCSTPWCALGHYAYRTDLQNEFSLVGDIVCSNEYTNGLTLSEKVAIHFGITNQEENDLFCMLGCNRAKTPQAAIAYIEAFIASKWSVEPTPQLDPAYEAFKKTLQLEVEEESVA